MPTTPRHAETFGIALERALGDRSKAWLADKVGVSPQLVTNWTQGEREPLPRKAVLIEQVLGVPTGSLTIHLGYLPPDAATVAVTSPEDALIADPELTGEDKRLLLGYLKRFRGDPGR